MSIRKKLRKGLAATISAVGVCFGTCCRVSGIPNKDYTITDLDVPKEENRNLQWYGMTPIYRNLEDFGVPEEIENEIKQRGAEILECKTENVGWIQANDKNGYLRLILVKGTWAMGNDNWFTTQALRDAFKGKHNLLSGNLTLYSNEENAYVSAKISCEYNDKNGERQGIIAHIHAQACADSISWHDANNWSENCLRIKQDGSQLILPEWMKKEQTLVPPLENRNLKEDKGGPNSIKTKEKNTKNLNLKRGALGMIPVGMACYLMKQAIAGNIPLLLY